MYLESGSEKLLSDDSPSKLFANAMLWPYSGWGCSRSFSDNSQSVGSSEMSKWIRPVSGCSDVNGHQQNAVLLPAMFFIEDAVAAEHDFILQPTITNERR